MDARRALQEYLAERPQVDDPHIFIGQRKNGLTDAAIYYVVKKYAYLAHLEGVSPHVLRHKFGRSLFDKGMDLVPSSSSWDTKGLTARRATPSQASGIWKSR